MTYCIVATVADASGKAAYAIRCTDQTNIVATLSRINGLQTAYICRTYKAAAELIATYNSGYEARGEYKYSCPDVLI